MDAELGFLCYTGRETAYFSRRLHILIASCFTAGLFMTWRDPQASWLTALMQASIVLHEIFQCRRLFLGGAAAEIRGHAIKTKMHAFLHLVVMAMVTISSSAPDGCSGAPWVAAGFLSLLSLADRLPLSHLARLQILKVVSMFGAVLFLGIDIRFKDAVAFVVLVGFVPYLAGAHAELRARQAYVQKQSEATTVVLKKFVDDHPLLAWTFGYNP